jgi:hypothetical protein
VSNGALPVRVRRITLAVIALSGLVGSAAAQHIGHVVEIESFRNVKPPISPFWESNKTAVVAAKAKHEAHTNGLESMRGSRGFILLALTVACSLTFVAALRMLRPAGAAREGARRLLVSTAIACAVLRTMDGAQMAALASKAGAAWDKVMSGSDIPGGYLDGLEQSVQSATAIGFTVLIAGAFVAVASYFRSDSLRQQIEAADRSEPV